MTELEHTLRERFRSLQDSVSPPPDLWDEIERRAAKRGPSQALGAMAAAVVLVVGLALVALVMRGDGADHKVVASNGAADEPCGRPLPRPGPDYADLRPSPLGGPAPSALTGGAAQSSFSLDDGGLVVKPPRAGDDPSVSKSDTECVALTSRPRDGHTLLSPRMVGTPTVAIGYGRVTIAADVKPMQMDVRRSADAPPTVPPSPPTYQDRLAWIVVVPDERASSCPAFRPPAPPPAPPPVATDYSYRVLLLDAHSGSSAVVYTEGGPGGCGGPRQEPETDVPVQTVSVPWKLGTRDKHNYTATISAEVLPCDDYDTTNFVGIDPYGPTAVVVQRPVDAHCGAAKSVQFTLSAATDVLPANIGHAPLGPYIEPEHDSPPPQGPPPVMILPPDNGKTFTVKVGTVLEMPTMDYAHPHPVHSSDPDVVGDIGPPGGTGNISSFRAWRAGEVDLTLADGWKVHVVVQ